MVLRHLPRSVYGVLVLLYPFTLMAMYFAPEWEDTGITVLAAVVTFIAENDHWLALAVAAVVRPDIARRARGTWGRSGFRCRDY
jgi:hypothetical protein